MDNFKFNFLLRGQLESLSLDKILLSGFKNNNMSPGFSGNLIFAIIARMLCGNHLKRFLFLTQSNLQLRPPLQNKFPSHITIFGTSCKQPPLISDHNHY